jgi:LPXTG-motif cell wall-anchored protein
MSLRRTLFLTLALVVGSVVLATSPAGATENPDYTAPPPTSVVTTPAPATKVKTAVAVTPVRTRLAITGSDATGTAVLGVSLVALGAVVLVLRRRRVATL